MFAGDLAVIIMVLSTVCATMCYARNMQLYLLAHFARLAVDMVDKGPLWDGSTGRSSARET